MSRPQSGRANLRWLLGNLNAGRLARQIVSEETVSVVETQLHELLADLVVARVVCMHCQRVSFTTSPIYAVRYSLTHRAVLASPCERAPSKLCRLPKQQERMASRAARHQDGH